MKRAVSVGTVAMVIALFSALPLQADMVGHWTFNNCDGADSSGNGHHGTLVGDPVCVSGVAGNALEFDGDNPDGDYCDIGTSQDYNLTKFSVCAWINPLEDAAGLILSKAGSFSVGLYNGMYVQGAIWITGHWVQYHSSVSNPQDPIPADTWTCVCVTYGDGYMRFYIDGQLVNSYQQSSVPDQTDDPIYIGYASGASGMHYFDGRMDEVRLYNDVLTPEDVSALCQSGQSACACPDTDGDGVPDAWDACPETPRGRVTDSKGCVKGGAVVILD